mgnify:CR=1 FL=1
MVFDTRRKVMKVAATLALSAWAVIPFDSGWVIANLNVGVLYIFAISSLGVYGIVLAGWASNSKYAFLGALRSAAQMVSYEVAIGFILISVVMWAGSFNLTDIVEAQKSVLGYLLKRFFDNSPELLVVNLLVDLAYALLDPRPRARA